MTSILTNNASMVALQTLNATQSALTSTQNMISTGLKVSSAKDNSSTWAIATQMRGDTTKLGQVSTNLSSADNLVGTALAGATQISSLISQIRGKIVSESDPSQNSTDIQNDIKSLVGQIQNIVSGSSYNGINLLSGNNTSVAFASTVVSNTAGLSQVSSISVSAFTGVSAQVGSATSATAITDLNTTSSGGLSSLANFESQSISTSNLQAQLQIVDTAANAVSSVAAALGSAQSNIESQNTFVKNLADTLQTGVGSMVDADMTAESARLSALQTQQSLGIQALSIANQAPQSVLKLFQ